MSRPALDCSEILSVFILTTQPCEENKCNLQGRLLRKESDKGEIS